jgi:hypothetical protein
MFAALFLALWRGWVVPGSTIDRLTAMWEARLKEAHEREQAWRVAHDLQTQISHVATTQTGELMQSFAVLESYIRSTPDAIARLRSVPPPDREEETG